MANNKQLAKNNSVFIKLFINADIWMQLILSGVLTAVGALAINSFVFLSKSDRTNILNILKTNVLHCN